MIIPSFGDYAPKPALAASFLGGVAAAQRDTSEMNQTAQHAAQLQLAQQKLQQDAVQNNMEFMARQQTLQQQSMLREQQLRIENQYKEQMISMDQMKIQQAGQKLQMQAAQEARLVADENEWSNRVQGGEDAAEVATEMGPRAHLPSGAYTSLIRKPQAQLPPAMMESVEGDESGRFKSVQTGPNTRRIIDTERAGGGLAEKRFEFAKQKAAEQSIQNQIRSLERANESPAGKIGYFAKSKLDRGDKLNPAQKKAADQYDARIAEIDSLRAKLKGEPTSSSQTKFTEGQIITHKKTGDKYRVTNGRPVLITSGSEDDESSGEDNTGE